jgi:lysophospholipase L1-like esterase
MNKPYNFSTAVMVVMVSIIVLFTTFKVSWGQTYKIMPLGDSITRGVTGSTAPGGYRDDLQILLTDELVSYDFVGSQSDGSGFDSQHEGHEGATAEYIDNNVTSWVSSASPQFILLNIGTNDLGVIHIETIAEKVSSICDKIYGVDGGITILLSGILPRDDNTSKDSLASRANRLIKKVAVEKHKAGQYIYYVGTNELLKHNPDWATDYMFDGIHPNDTGYNQMAQLFWSAIMNVIKKEGSIIIDNFNRSVIGIAWEYDPAFTLETVSTGQRELKNTSTEDRWNILAVYKAVNNPGEVSLRWGKNTTALGIENGGLALRLNKASTTANGYLLRIQQDGTLNLWTIVNGYPSEDIASEPGTQPAPGQVFKVVLSSDAVAHHFHCYIDDNYVGTVSDFERRRGNEAELYAGVMLRGSVDSSNSLENNIDDFNLHIIGDVTPPARINNLSVLSTSASTVTLSWTVPGDDSLSDQASYYDIRYSKNALTEDNWDNAVQATNIERPGAPNSTASFVVMGLEGDIRYYFGIKAADEEYNWSALSNVVNATTGGGAALQSSDNFDNPNSLTELWSANPVYAIQGGELVNTSTAITWGHLAVFKANVNPVEASITWSQNATSDGIDKGALALLLDSNNYSTANGYAAWIRTMVGEDPVLYLFTLKIGSPDVFLGTYTVQGGTKPGPGDVFKVAVASDANGHHFDYYVNEKFYGRLDDPAKTYSNGTDYYMGIELHGNLNNNVDRFVTTNTIGDPEIIEKVKPLDTTTGIVGKPLSDSLTIRVTDKNGNPIGGLNVDFTVIQGGGHVDIQQQDNYVRIEAENATVLESPMEIGVDPGASNSQFIVPNGGVPLEGKAEFNFYAKEAGTYVIWSRMFLPDNSRLSLFVQVDDKPAISASGDPPPSDGVWDFQSYELGFWEWRIVTDRAKNGDVATFNLSKGNHKLTITQRVGTGTKIDKILLSNNYNYIPSGLEAVPHYMTGSDGQARAQFTPGTVAGENRVEVIVPGYNLTGSPVVFIINGNADTPVSMVASSPVNQNGVGGQKLAQPFEVTLKDKYNNAAANYEITFTVTEGDGFLSNDQTVHKVTSDNNGKAATYLTLGTEYVNNKVVASFGSLSPINFTATATTGIANAMQYESGNSQSAKVGTTLQNPLKVKIIDKQGNPIVNHNVKFQITTGGGSLVPAMFGSGNEFSGESVSSDISVLSNAAPSMDVLTNSNGIAAARLVVGLEAGINTVEAKSNASGAPLTPIVFNAIAVPDSPDSLVEVSGNNQTGASGMSLSNPFIVKVTDQHNNPIYGHEVQFSVTAGDGYLDGKTERTKSVLTDPDGKAQVYLTLGDVAGVSNQVTAESYIGEELIQNPGFEVAGIGGIDVFANWIVEQHGATTVNNETNQVHGGSHACRFNIVSGVEYHTTLIQNVSLNVNQEYELSWWGKISGETQIAYFIKNDDTKHWWRESTQEWVETYTANQVTMTSDYQRYTVRIKRENTGTNYQIHFRPIVNSNHTFYVDDFSLTLYLGDGTNYSGKILVDPKQSTNMLSTLMPNTITPLRGSPIIFKATPGLVTSIGAKSSLNHTGSAGLPLDDSLEVYIRDNYANPVGGYPVTFSSTSGDNPGTFNGHSAHEIKVLTDNHGIARVAFHCGIKPGVASSAKASATGLTGSPVSFNASVAQLTEFKYVDGDSQSGPVGSVLPKPLKAKVIDQRGKAIPKFDITFKVIAGDGKISGDSIAVIKTDTTTKVASAIFTLGPNPGADNNIVEATAIYQGKPLPGSPIRYKASSFKGEPTELVEAGGNYQITVVGSPLENPLAIKVTDAFTNPIAAHPVTFTVKTGEGHLDGDSLLKTVTKNTNANGEAKVILTVGRASGQNNNSVEVIAYKPGTTDNLINSPMTYYASGTASAAHTLETVSGTGQPRSPVRQALPQPFVVKVKDRDKNAVTDHPVQWEVVQGGGTFDGLIDSIKTVNTSANGLVQVYYYPGPVAGLQNVVRVRSWNQVELNGSPRTFVIDTKVGPVSASKSDISTTSPVPADGATQSKITVTLMDDSGNRISGKYLALSPPPSGSGNSYTTFSDTTDINGQAFAYLASTRAEVKKVYVKEISGIQLQDTALVRFTPLVAHHIDYVTGTDQIGNFGTVVQDPIKAIVLDINGNPIPGHSVQFEAYEGGGYIWEHQGLESPFVYTDQNGIASAYWVMGPSAEVNRARAVAEGLENSGHVRYIATAHEGIAVKIKEESGNKQFGTAGLPLDDPLIVKVVDNNDDPIFDFPVKFNVSFGGGNFSGASNVYVRTDPFGCVRRSFTLGRVAGANVVSVEAPGLLNSPVGFTAQGVAGEAAKIVKWAGQGKSGPVGGQIKGIQVKVTDIFDNAVSGYTVNFAINKGNATINGNGAIVSGPDGIASMSINVGTTIGEIEIMVGTPGLIGDGLRIRVYAVASTAVAMQEYHGNDQQGTIERELVYPFSVMVLDQYGNSAGGQNVPISFIVTQGNGMVLDRTVYADANGIASARFQLGNVIGNNYKVWAINNSLNGSPVEFKATGVTNKFPIFDPIPDVTIRENQNISFKVTATDDDQDPVRYGVRNLPPGALFDSLGIKQFSWTPNYFQAGTHVVHFMAWDNKGGFDDEPVTITVENVNRLPQITYYEPINTELVGHKNVGETFRFLVQVNDPDNDILIYEWYDNDILVSSKNSYAFYVTDEYLGSHYIKVKVSDGYDSIERNWSVNVKVPVQLAHFSGHIVERQGVELEWETTVEAAHAGFNILRKSASERDYQQINKHTIKPEATKKYHYFDRNVNVGETYSYKLEDVSITGEKTQHDPITVFVTRPKDFRLYQNYPNPFNPKTHIEYQLPKQTRISLKIYNIMGQEVRTLVDEVKEAGYHSVIWNGLDNNGTPITSGIYYYRMVTDSHVEVKKMVLLR